MQTKHNNYMLAYNFYRFLDQNMYTDRLTDIQKDTDRQKV